MIKENVLKKSKQSINISDKVPVRFDSGYYIGTIIDLPSGESPFYILRLTTHWGEIVEIPVSEIDILAASRLYQRIKKERRERQQKVEEKFQGIGLSAPESPSPNQERTWILMDMNLQDTRRSGPGNLNEQRDREHEEFTKHLDAWRKKHSLAPYSKGEQYV